MLKRWLAVTTASGLLLGAVIALPASAHTERLEAGLNGDKEVPGPGDPNGKGNAVIKLKDEEGKICYNISFKKIGKAMAAHIHQGGRKSSGDVVVTLWSGAKGSPQQGCVEASSDTIGSIAANPRQYYVNLHTEAYPDGAIRGQLRRE